MSRFFLSHRLIVLVVLLFLVGCTAGGNGDANGDDDPLEGIDARVAQMIEESLEEVLAQMEVLEGQVEALEAANAALEAEVAALKGQATSMDTDVSGLKTLLAGVTRQSVGGTILCVFPA